MADELTFDQAYNQLKQMETALKPFRALSEVLNVAMQAQRDIDALTREREKAEAQTDTAKEALARLLAQVDTAKTTAQQVAADTQGIVAAKQREATVFDRDTAARRERETQEWSVLEAQHLARIEELRAEETGLRGRIDLLMTKLEALKTEAKQLAT